MTREFKMFDYFIQGYFHQDWDEDGDSDEEIVIFCKSEGCDIISSVIESFFYLLIFIVTTKVA